MEINEIIDQAKALVAFYGLRVIGAIAILILGRIIAGIAKNIIGKIMTKNKVDQTLISFVCSVSYVAMMTFVIIAAIGALEIKTAQFVAVLGAAGLAVGLALQGSLSNFAAGVLMIIFKPLKNAIRKETDIEQEIESHKEVLIMLYKKKILSVWGHTIPEFGNIPD